MLNLGLVLHGAPLHPQSLAVTSRTTGRVVIIDVASGESVQTYATGSAPHEMATRPGAGLLWVPSYGGRGIVEIDVVTGDTRELAVQADSLHEVVVAPDGRRLWAVSETDSTIIEVDTRTGEVIGRLPHGLGLGHMLAASPDGTLLWVPDLWGHGVARIDRSTGEVRTIPTGTEAEDVVVAPDGSEVWITLVGSDEILILSAEGAEQARFPSAGDLPVKIRFSPDARQAWVSNNQSGVVAVFDRVTRERVASIAVGERPLGIAFSGDGTRAYVTRPGAAEIVEVDAVSFEVLRRIEAPPSPDGIEWIPALPVPDGVARFITPDGAIVFADLHRTAVEPARAFLLFFHQGGSSGRAEYRNVVPRLLASGYDIGVVDLPEGGNLFGGLNRAVQHSDGSTPGFCETYPAVEAALDWALVEAEGRPIVAVGSSYSGALVLQLAGRRTDGLAGVVGFSPASGGPMIECLGRTFTEGVELPILAIRPVSETSLPTVRDDLAALEEQGHRTWVARPGVHGASMLDPARVENSEATWDVFESWLSEVLEGGPHAYGEYLAPGLIDFHGPLRSPS
jgi:YVTN family beta-propeller protein